MVEKENNLRYSNYIVNPVHHCYFCERAINSKNEKGDKFWPFIKNIANFPRVFKITDLPKEDAVLCGECWDKYWALIEAQGIGEITKELEKIKKENEKVKEGEEQFFSNCKI